MAKLIYNTKMDLEIRQLLAEVAQKDWETELLRFREERTEQMVQENVRSHLDVIRESGLGPGAWYGLFVGVLAGISLPMQTLLFVVGAFMLTGISLCTWIGGLGYLLGLALLVITPGLLSFTGFLIGMGYSFAGSVLLGSLGFVSGGLVYGLIKEQALRSRETELLAETRIQFQHYSLSPEDLRRFFERRMKPFLQGRQNLLASRIRESRKTIQECQNLALELQQIYTDEHAENIVKLKLKQCEQEEILKDALRVNALISRIDKTFADRIKGLEELLKQRQALERKEVYRSRLMERVSLLLSDRTVAREQWNEDKTTLKAQMEGLIIAFADEIRHASDLLQAEIELLDQRKDQLNAVSQFNDH